MALAGLESFLVLCQGGRMCAEEPGGNRSGLPEDTCQQPGSHHQRLCSTMNLQVLFCLPIGKVGRSLATEELPRFAGTWTKRVLHKGRYALNARIPPEQCKGSGRNVEGNSSGDGFGSCVLRCRPREGASVSVESQTAVVQEEIEEIDA